MFLGNAGKKGMSAIEEELEADDSVAISQYLIHTANILDDQYLFLVIHQEDDIRFAIACKDMFDD